MRKMGKTLVEASPQGGLSYMLCVSVMNREKHTSKEPRHPGAGVCKDKIFR